MPATPGHLRTEYQIDPLGLDETEPRLSWRLQDDRRGARQTAYQVLVASSLEQLSADQGDLWDSGRVESDATAHIVYSGVALRAFSRAVWKVRLWDGDGATSPWSEAARFELGPLTSDDWRLGRGGGGDGGWSGAAFGGAAFIAAPVVGDPKTSAPAPYLRRSFKLEGEVLSARLYITALGLYEASINGRRVTDDVYRPGWTDYHRRVPYQAYDVTDLLRPGANALGVILGDGWYCGFIVADRQHWGERPHLLARLVIEVAGVEDPVIVCSDEMWRTSTGPILVSDNYNGESYDARLELPGWDEPGYDDGAWEAVVNTGSVRMHRTCNLVATTAPPVRRILELAPQAVSEREPGVYQFDFGQNMTGRTRLRIEAPYGTTLTLQFAEMLNADGSLHRANLGSAEATDRYICKGDGVEVYEPRFTFHGFRYAEISGAPAALDASALTGVVLHSAAEISGEFSCSNDLVNQLQHNIQWGQRGNFLDVPTDCPQRDERLGFTGDIQVFARTATFNMDVAAFLTKYVIDLRDAQFAGGIERGTYPWVAPSVFQRAGGPGWADAGVIVPWVVYERYGDLRVLERHYTSILEYIAFLERAAAGRAEGTWLGFGDWLSLDAVAQQIDSFGREDFGGTAREYIWHAFDIHSTELASRIAELLGRDEDAKRFRARAQQRREEFAGLYVDGTGHLTETTQTAYVLALYFDLLISAAHRSAAEADLVASIEHVGHLQTGFIGTPYLLHVLSDIGRSDLAYSLLERTDYPGWLYPVTHGATTIWERWDAWTKEGGFRRPHIDNSFNHYAYGAVGEWLFRVVAGIDTTLEGAGYRHILVRPELGGSLTSAEAHVDTIHGRLATAWQLQGAERAILRVSLPPNTSGTLRLPATSAALVSERGVTLPEVEGISAIGTRDGRLECQAAAGSYEFVIEAPIIATKRV